MHVDIEEMRSGASLAYGAAWLAVDGAGQLSRSGLPANAFGRFAAAQSFGSALNQARSGHLKLLHSHEARLNALGDNAHTAAGAFVDMEERNAEALRTVL